MTLRAASGGTFAGFVKPGALAGYMFPLTILNAAGTPAALAANRVYYLPFYFPSVTITKIGLEITTLAAGAGIMGLYADANGLPGSLIAQAASTVNTGVASSGGVPTELTFASGVALPNDIVWGAWQSNAGPTARIGTAANASAIPQTATNAAGPRGITSDTAFTYTGTLPASAYVTGAAYVPTVPLLTLRV